MADGIRRRLHPATDRRGGDVRVVLRTGDAQPECSADQGRDLWLPNRGHRDSADQTDSIPRQAGRRACEGPQDGEDPSNEMTSPG